MINKRLFLKGIGTLIALPKFETFASDKELNIPTNRFAFVYIPNGVNIKDWNPSSGDSNFILSKTLSPLEPLKSKVQIMSGFTHEKAFANGDGAGDHARASATFLTGCQARKTDGTDIRAGKSIDQVIADSVGDQTKLKSLEISCDTARFAGNCDSGYSCAYQYNISWKSAVQPLAPESNPRLLFERLFGTESQSSFQERERRRLQSKSILDFVMDDAKTLHNQLGKNDKVKLEQYMDSIRSIEKKIENEERFRKEYNIKNTFSEPRDYDSHLSMMYELLFLAFQNDLTRVATFIVSHDGSNRSYPLIEVRDGHHDLSHHQNNEEKLNKITKINTYHVQHFYKFLNMLNSHKEGNNSLLDNSTIIYGSGIGDGNRHNHDNLPILLCGKGGGTLNSGRHVNVNKVPMTNMFLGILNKNNIKLNEFGDSSGIYNNI